MDLLDQEQMGKSRRPPAVWARNPDLRLWASPIAGLSTGAVQGNEAGDCLSQQSHLLKHLPNLTGKGVQSGTIQTLTKQLIHCMVTGLSKEMCQGCWRLLVEV